MTLTLTRDSHPGPSPWALTLDPHPGSSPWTLDRIPGISPNVGSMQELEEQVEMHRLANDAMSRGDFSMRDD